MCIQGRTLCGGCRTWRSTDSACIWDRAEGKRGHRFGYLSIWMEVGPVWVQPETQSEVWFCCGKFMKYVGVEWGCPSYFLSKWENTDLRTWQLIIVYQPSMFDNLKSFLCPTSNLPPNPVLKLQFPQPHHPFCSACPLFLSLPQANLLAFPPPKPSPAPHSDQRLFLTCKTSYLKHFELFYFLY